MKIVYISCFGSSTRQHQQPKQDKQTTFIFHLSVLTCQSIYLFFRRKIRGYLKNMHPFYIVLSKPKIRYWTMVCFTFMHYSKVQDPQTPGVLVLMKLGNVACCSAVPIRGGGGERQLCAVSCGVLQGQQCGQVCIMLHLSHRLCHRRQRDHLPQRLRHQ